MLSITETRVPYYGESLTIPGMTTLRTLASRLKWAREAAELTQEQLATACSWDPKTGQTRISHYETGRTTKVEPDDLQVISKALQLHGVRVATPGWLQYGEGHGTNNNFEAGPDVVRRVPEVSWITAGKFAEMSEPYPSPEDVERWHPYAKRGGGRVVALRVRGDSMTAPYGKSYPDGSIIFVNLDMRAPLSGQRIVAKLEHEPEATFKVYAEDAGRIWLKALNPGTPPILDPFTVVGTVVGKWEDE